MVYDHAKECRCRVCEGRTPEVNPGCNFGQTERDTDDPSLEHQGLVFGFRYVEVFHLAHAVILGWSPNTDRFLAAEVLPDPQNPMIWAWNTRFRRLASPMRLWTGI